MGLEIIEWGWEDWRDGDVKGNGTTPFMCSGSSTQAGKVPFQEPYIECTCVDMVDKIHALLDTVVEVHKRRKTEANIITHHG